MWRGCGRAVEGLRRGYGGAAEGLRRGVKGLRYWGCGGAVEGMWKCGNTNSLPPRGKNWKAVLAALKAEPLIWTNRETRLQRRTGKRDKGLK
eukprot:1031378-Prorocentrum_minimum.AAC.1